MRRYFVLGAALLAATCAAGRLSAEYRAAIIPETTAARHGLTRPWFSQVPLDRGRSRVRHVVFHEDVLYVQTDRAMVQAIDAETGETLWARHVGRPDHPSMVPGLNRDLLVVVNGSRLYICNRYNGDLLREVRIDNAPGAGAAVSQLRAFVPMVNGLVMAYRLNPVVDPLQELGKNEGNITGEQQAIAEEDRRENIRIRQEYLPPLACRSTGRTLVQPLVTSENESEEYVAWPTDRGYLNIALIDRRQEDHFAIKFRLETDAGIAARPSYLPPDPELAGDSGVIYGASRDGFVHAIEEQSGESLWRFSTGEPIVEPAVVIGQRVYVTTQPGALHCLDAKTGAEHWWAPRIVKFVSASKERVYAADKLGRVLILSAKTGAKLDVLEASALPVKLSNWRTDRLYLATKTGLIQCLHEVELSEPIRHDAIHRQAAAGQRPMIEQGPADVVPPPVPDQPAPAGDQAPDGGANPPEIDDGAPADDDDPFANPFN